MELTHWQNRKFSSITAQIGLIASIPILIQTGKPILGSFILLILFLLYRLYLAYRQYQFFSSQGIQGHPFSPLLGNSLTLYGEMKSDKGLKPLHDYHSKYGNIHLNYIGPSLYLSINSPPHIHQIYKLTENYWKKSDATISALEILLGEPKEVSAESSLFFQSFDAHARSRRLQAPFFHFSSLTTLHNTIQQETIRAMNELASTLQSSKEERDDVIDLQTWFQSLTLSIILSSAFSSSLHTRPAAKLYLMHSLSSGVRGSFLRLLFPIDSIPLLRSLPIFYKPDIEAARTTLLTTVRDIIKEREAVLSILSPPSPHEDMLDLLLNARDSEGGLSDTQIEHDSLFYLFAGHDTLTSTLTWTVYELLQHPAAMDALLQEINSIKHNGQESDYRLTLSQLSQLKVCESIILESIRLHPPVPNLSKECIQAHTIEVEGCSPLHIPVGTKILVRPCIVNKLKEYWGDDADIWDYSRWMRGKHTGLGSERDERGERLTGSVPYSHSAAFISFSYGSRDCLGKGFALIEAKTVLFHLFCRFEIVLAAGQKVIELLTASLRAKYGIQAIVKLRGESKT